MCDIMNLIEIWTYQEATIQLVFHEEFIKSMLTNAQWNECSVDYFGFTKETFNGKLYYFLCSDYDGGVTVNAESLI